MRVTPWFLALGIGLAAAHLGCGAPQRPALARFAGPAPPAAGDADEPDDPCADPDVLDGLDDPCWVDVPPEEVRRVLAGAPPGPAVAPTRSPR